MTGRLTAITMLAVALCAPVPASASSINLGGAARPHLSIRPNIVRPTIRPHIRVPSLGRHLARRLRKKHQTHARMRWTGSWSTEIVSSRHHEPTSADAHDRHANADVSYLLGRMPRATGGGTNEIRFEDKKGGEIVKGAKKVARPLLIVAEDVEGESINAGGAFSVPKNNSAMGLLLPAVQAAR